jgi:nuclear cap-binding protein subunit 2
MELEKYFGRKRELFAYRDRTFKGTDEEYKRALGESKTLYVGEVSTSVREERIWEIFGLCGSVRRVIMGINRNNSAQCGFCFVEYYTVEDANRALVCLNGFRMDDKFLKCDIDYGFVEGRQYGRGIFGGQYKDDNTKRRRL